MEAGKERRKLLCQCGKPLGIFTAQGLELYCRFSGRGAGAAARGRGGR